MKTIVLTGASGLIGSRITELLSSEFTFIPVPSTEMDITNRDEVYAKLKNTSFDMFLHLAAYTNVDGAETDMQQAYNINVTGTKNVFEVVNELKKPFIHFSTDFVFDGVNPPFNESSPRNPISEYGKTKALAEEIIEDNAMIIRIAYPYRSRYEKRSDFVRAIIKRLKDNGTIQGITDSVFTPTFIDDIANGLQYLCNNFSPEIFHLVGGSSLTPYEAFNQIAEVFDLDKKLIGQTTYEAFFSGKAKRPKNCTVVRTKPLPFTMRSFSEGLAEMKNQLVI